MSTKMPRMIYTKAPHIKNRNAVGFVVKCAAQPDMPFFKLPEALEYCETMGLPDDADHLILDPANARLLAVPLLHHAEYERKLLEKLSEKADGDLRALCAQRDKKTSEKSCKSITDQIELKRLNEKILEAIAVGRGIYESDKTLGRRIYELWQLTRMGAKPNWR